MPTSLLHSRYQLGRVELANRVVMSPMTRNRATGNVANALMAEYYAQRSGAGLIITEGTSPSPNGLGYPRIPGLFDAAQVAGFREVTRRVHEAGGRIFVQLMHTGRVGHPLNLPEGARLLGPSAIAVPGEMYTDQRGPQAHPVPTAMTEEDIEHAIAEYRTSAGLALEAGFDGVELHGANGYLIEQFLNVGANQRDDRWGGSVENRIRFAVEVAKATAEAIGADRVGMRISPYGVFNGTVADPDTDAVYVALAEALSELGLVYVHTVDHTAMGAPTPSPELYREVRRVFRGTRILSGGYDAERAERDLEADLGDLVAFGRPFISNPDLVEKLADGRPLATPNHETFYTPGPVGYTDYALG